MSPSHLATSAASSKHRIKYVPSKKGNNGCHRAKYCVMQSRSWGFRRSPTFRISCSYDWTVESDDFPVLRAMKACSISVSTPRWSGISLPSCVRIVSAKKTPEDDPAKRGYPFYMSDRTLFHSKRAGCTHWADEKATALVSLLHE